MALGWLLNLDFAGSGAAAGASARGNLMLTGLGCFVGVLFLILFL